MNLLHKIIPLTEKGHIPRIPNVMANHYPRKGMANLNFLILDIK